MKKYFQLFNIVVLIALFACTPPKSFLLRKKWKSNVDKHNIRVLLVNTRSRIKITSNSAVTVFRKQSGRTLFTSYQKPIFIYPERLKKSIVIKSKGLPIFINGKPYRGYLEINNVFGRLNVINIIRIDEYLYSVVPSEIPALWDMNALMAQAVAARTYTYYHLLKKRNNTAYDLDATTNYQVYKGVTAERDTTNLAVKKTSGQVIVSNYKPIIAYFHSTCGGRTTDDKYVWKGNDKKYLKSITCRYCKDSPKYKWKARLSLYEMKMHLRKRYPKIANIKRIIFRKKAGRVHSVSIYHSNGLIKVTGNNFRLLFPSKKIMSMNFRSRKYSNGIVLVGKGWGHGVGMCQWGAKGMAETGRDYKRILKHYYHNIRISNIKNVYIASKKKPKKTLFSLH
ncbi:SpoIID/LytB domain-containing protein [Spirochaetota bacterium]